MTLSRLAGVVIGIALALNVMPAQAAELKEIQRRGYLIVAVKDNLRPLGFRNARGQLQGLEIDIAQRLAEVLLGRKDAIALKPVTNSARIPVLLAGQVDLTIARVTATAARSRLVNFSTPYYVDGTGLVTKDPAIRTLSDLENRTVAVLNGSSTIATLRFILPQAKLVGVGSYQAGRSRLDGGASAFAADASVLSGWVQEAPQYRQLPSLLSAEPLAVALPKGLQYEPLRLRINEAITQWRSNGWLKARSAYWGLPVSQPLPRPFDRLEETN